MSLRNILFIVASVLLISATALFAHGWASTQRTPMAAPAPTAAQPVDATRVLVASRDLPTGSFVKPEHLRWQSWPNGHVAESYLVHGEAREDDVLGAVVRRGIVAGEPISIGRIVKPGDRGFLAAVLGAGYRALAVPVDAASGIAGLIFPGDRVDIILSHSVGGAAQGQAVRRAAETVLTNVRVLALDQRVDDQNGDPKLAKTATLEVTPKQAELLAVVRELGHLSLSLRSLARDEAELDRLARSGAPLEESPPEPGNTYTWDSDASALLSGRGPAGAVRVVQVGRGNKTENVLFQR